MKKLLCLTVMGLSLTGCHLLGPKDMVRQEAASVSLFSESLDGWEKINFGGEGDIYFQDGALHLDSGNPLTGLRYTGDLKALLGEGQEHYAITLKAQRVQGVDMFLGLTFPVGQAGHVSLVLGGWGGAVTGLSNLDGLNASENATTQYHALKDKQWFRVKVVVTADKIRCWLDREQIVDVDRAKFRDYRTHSAVESTVPLGMFSYSTWGAVKDVRVVRLEP